MEKCYSYTNDGEFTEDLCYVLECASEDCKVGDTFTIYEGDSYKPDITKFVDAEMFLENLTENVADNFGEYCESWCCGVMDSPKESFDSFQKGLDELVKKWIKEFGNEIDFYEVTNIQEVHYKLIDPDNFEYERLD